MEHINKKGKRPGELPFQIFSHRNEMDQDSNSCSYVLETLQQTNNWKSIRCANKEDKRLSFGKTRQHVHRNCTKITQEPKKEKKSSNELKCKDRNINKLYDKNGTTNSLLANLNNIERIHAS